MNDRRPRFSVVIPTRDRAETLRVTLATCLDQDFDDYEIGLDADGDSDDESLADDDSNP